MFEALRDAARAMPERPGVYIFRDEQDTVLYVGKAKSLRARTRSYFQSTRGLAAKTIRLVQDASRLEFIVTRSEVEALVLEQNLIKEHRPKYNVLLKDDKRYPYLKLTNETFPRLLVVRKVQPDGARYFGPFPSSGRMQETLRVMRRLFPLRTCSDQKFRTVTRPCLMYHIGRCSAPCTGVVNEAQYRETAAEADAFLSGHPEEVLRRLRTRMDEAAEALRFEEAAELRDRIRAVEYVTSPVQQVDTGQAQERDVVGIAREGERAVGQIFRVRDGKLVGRERYVLRVAEDDPEGEIVSAVLALHYQEERPPREVLVSALPEDAEVLTSWLESRREANAEVRVPQRGSGVTQLHLAQENARIALSDITTQDREARPRRMMEALQEALALENLPRRIEGFDISNTQGHESVASMVVFVDGQPAYGEYRRFRIKTVQGPNDFASLAEAVGRRFTRGLREQREGGGKFAQFPELLLIDGGKGQLSSVMSVLQELGLQDQPTISLAKQHEEIYLPEESDPLQLGEGHPGRILLQLVRDESHRFALGLHRQRRGKASLHSRLDDVPGIGPKRRRALLERFGSLRGVQSATIEEIAAVRGFTIALARRVKEEIG
jgi:excinuclease ABC subunit C